MLLGGSYGLLVGSLFDLDEEERTETTLGEISKSVQAERTAVLAVVSEPSPEGSTPRWRRSAARSCGAA